MTDRITIRVGGRDLEGWLQSTVQRSIESLSGTFSVPVGLVPGQPPAVARQADVQVLIGGHPVVTGYVLSADPFYDEKDCGQQVTGRDRSGDLVRCSAIHKGGQWRKAKLDRIVKDLTAPFGVDVAVVADVGAAFDDFKLYHGESVLDAISRAARLRGVLLVPDSAGRLLLTKAGTGQAPAALRRGVNVISMQGVGSDEHRHSEYIAYGQGSMVAGDLDGVRQRKAAAKDEDVKRYLPLIMNADGNVSLADLQALADHTARVRRGHAYGFRYTVEGWTANGVPWPINARVPIHDDVAGLDGAEWLICSVVNTVDLRKGAITELLVRPIEAYDTVPLKTRVKHRRRHGKARGKGQDGAWLEGQK